MKNWKVLLLVAAGVAMSGFFRRSCACPVVNPPRPDGICPGRWRLARTARTRPYLGLTLGQSTLRDAVGKLGRRYEIGIFRSGIGD
ncbi:MAG: hypothetical protein R3F44_00245 [Candidatus Competibacteraceae bacterium]